MSLVTGHRWPRAVAGCGAEVPVTLTQAILYEQHVVTKAQHSVGGKEHINYRLAETCQPVETSGVSFILRSSTTAQAANALA